MLPKKIIGIGLPRTGNVTLAACVRQLFEFQTVGWNKQAAEAVVGNDWRTVQEMAAGNRCLTELPWAAIFRKLDTWFPDSKFVLTYRDPHTWIESMTEQIDKIRNPETAGGAEFRRWFFGAAYPLGNEQQYTRRYVQHIQEVSRYFQTSKKLLIISWEQHGWTELCNFLGISPPAITFPHLNKGTIHGKEILHL